MVKGNRKVCRLACFMPKLAWSFSKKIQSMCVENRKQLKFLLEVDFFFVFKQVIIFVCALPSLKYVWQVGGAQMLDLGRPPFFTRSQQK